MIDFCYAVFPQFVASGRDVEQEFVEDNVLAFVHRHCAYIVVYGDSVESFDGGFWHLVVSLVFPNGDEDGILRDGIDVGSEDVLQVLEWLFDATGFHPLVVDGEGFCIGHTAKVDLCVPD